MGGPTRESWPESFCRAFAPPSNQSPSGRPQRCITTGYWPRPRCGPYSGIMGDAEVPVFIVHCVLRDRWHGGIDHRVPRASRALHWIFHDNYHEELVHEIREGRQSLELYKCAFTASA